MFVKKSSHPDHTYMAMVEQILTEGEVREDRTGTGTISLFGPQMQFDLLDGFPLLTTKKVSWKNIWTELFWFLKGDTNIKFLNGEGNHIWDEWTNDEGDLGPVYGAMWRNWPSENGPIDQINQLIKNLRDNPLSRRHVISGWNPALLPDENEDHATNVANGRQALPPCHTLFQFYVQKMSTADRLRYLKNMLGVDPEDCELLKQAGDAAINQCADEHLVPTQKLNCKLYQRSADMFLGVPYNIGSYAMLTGLIAEMCDMGPGNFIPSFGDAHVYSNHIEQLHTQAKRSAKHLPFLDIDERVRGYESIDELRLDDLRVVGYQSHPAIKGAVAV